MNGFRWITRFAGIGMLLILLFSGCAKEEKSTEGASRAPTSTKGGTEEPFDVGVFVPGVVSGSPIYEMLVAGVEKAVQEYDHTSIKVIEGGFNQSEWIEQIRSLSSTAAYEVIVTSNPAMPEICAQVAEQYPEQKYLILDGFLEGHPNIHTFLYNQMEQAFLIGHLGGLVTTSTMEGINEELKAGLIAGQEYPIMNRVIKPGYTYGLSAAAGEVHLDFRVIGNWYDAAKAKELALSMFDGGVDVILAIAGGANQGIVTAAKERGKYVLWFDSNGYDIAPGTVIGSSAINQERAAYEKTKAAIEETLSFGTADIGGVKEGFVRFIEDDELYRNHVPEEIRRKQHEVIEEISSGTLTLDMPTF